jgi:glutamate dehydrogenase
MADHRDRSNEPSRLLGKVIESAREQRPDDPLVEAFLSAYYRELPVYDLDDRSADDLYRVASAHLDFGRRRDRGQTLLQVTTADRDRHGWPVQRSVVMMVTDDAPFLVDTMRIVLERLRVATHHMVHPIVPVERDDDGRLVAISGESDRLEAWTQIEIEAVDGDRARVLEDELMDAVARVHAAVSSFGAMQGRMCAFSDRDPVLDWLADRNFVFLAAASFVEVSGDEPDTMVEGSALGDVQIARADDPPIDWSVAGVAFARSDLEAVVHRHSRLTVVTVIDRSVAPHVAHRFFGLLASPAYRASVLSIPTVGERVRSVLDLAPFGSDTHTGRSMRNVVETLPRDVVFELDRDDLARLVISVVGLQERQIVRVFDVPEPVGEASTMLVYFPKQRFDASLPDRIAAIVGAAYSSDTDNVESFLDSSNLARVTFTVRRANGSPDLEQLADEIDATTTEWGDRLLVAAVDQLGADAATDLVSRFREHVPESYRGQVTPELAVADLVELGHVFDGAPTSARLVPDSDGGWRMRVYHCGPPIALSDLMPILSHLGLTVLDEHPHELDVDQRRCFVYDIGVEMPGGITVDDRVRFEIDAAIVGLLAGSLESDGFNRLIPLAGLTARQANLIRVYAKYVHQIGFTFSQGYIEECFARLPDLAALLVELFESRFDPDLDDGERLASVSNAENEILTLLDGVPSLDDDRIGRTFLALVRATVRTSYYRDRPTVAIKLDPAKVPDLPQPAPAHEIFVCSPRVEGVHLRGGPIARGGLRWSDRPEDYRTEVLGLVKAQMVKNAVIVPVGAKGGFVVKQPPAAVADHRAEGEACYRLFVRGLLDVTDNIVGGEVVPPDRVRRYDGDDAYLVVAADKGTATFSDVANEIAAEYGFWLGDAFASGGSEGYDHKEMGITARGAWESARRHARVLGLDADRDPLTVVGIGDMSGDVFGNGMLRSAHLRLVAAFDHRHIFIDPDPDPAVSYVERRRLFELPRSSWAEYRESLLSAGGGVYPRSAKSIELTPAACAVLGVDADRLAPDAVIAAILRAPVDMLWNGGIGTYVKATTESHLDVGDRANDTVRVNGSELRCRMVIEGGNLGVTQLGRVEYALNGGLIYTDAIDNSAGVDCSDHEVNIKILLGDVMASGELSLDRRNELLHSMTDEVAELVLANNKAQTLALLIARTQSLLMMNVHTRYLDQLEVEGWLDRGLEFLPTDKQIAERQAGGSGLRTPELAVMIAYTKNANITEILATKLPDDPALEEDVVMYFPTPLRDLYLPYIRRHRLRREIAVTQLVNQMVNVSGISYDHRMTEDTGASVTDVARAWLVAREVLDFPAWWAEIDELDGIELDDQLEMYLDCRRTAERCSLWFLRHRRPPIDIAAEVARFRKPVLALATELPDLMSGPIGRAARALAETRIEHGVPSSLAVRSSVWRVLHTAFDVVELGQRTGVDPSEVAAVYWTLFDRLDLLWLWDGIGGLPRSNRWQTQARSALRDDLLTHLIALTANVLEDGSFDRWISANERPFARTNQQLTQIRRSDSFDITNLSVALRQLRNLAQTSVRVT